MAADSPKRLIVVTGANKGIGFAIVRTLCKEHPDVLPVLTSRSEERGLEAVEQIREETGRAPYFHQLDITDTDSCAALAQWIDREHGGKLDTLINNAGFAYHGCVLQKNIAHSALPVGPSVVCSVGCCSQLRRDIFGADEAETTLRVNLHGTMNITTALLPALRSSRGLARIVNVCSQAGRLNQISVQLQEQVTARDLTQEKLVELARRYVDSIRAGRHREDGWSNSMYGVSKLLEIAYTMVLARELKETNVRVNACCPGWCDTDMTSHKGPRTPEQGADTPTWLATTDLSAWGERSTGGFYYDRRPISW